MIRASHVTGRLWRKQLEERGTEYEQNRRHNNLKQALKLLSCCALWLFVSRKETKMSTHFSANQVIWNRLYFPSSREEIRGIKRCFSLVICVSFNPVVRTRIRCSEVAELGNSKEVQRGKMNDILDELLARLAWETCHCFLGKFYHPFAESET